MWLAGLVVETILPQYKIIKIHGKSKHKMCKTIVSQVYKYNLKGDKNIYNK